MAKLIEPISDEELKKITVGNLRKEYAKLSELYLKIVNGDLLKCPKCGEFLNNNTAFYIDRNYKTERFPICKRCLMMMVEQKENKNDKPNETIESVQKVLRLMNLPYSDSFYRDCIKGAEDEVKEKNRKSPFATYITAMVSLPNWKGLTWEDSEFGDSLVDSDEDVRVVQKTIRAAKKRFGPGYSESDYMTLENEYQDWINRYDCSTKAQEKIFERLSFKAWEISKATKAGQNTKDLDKTYQELLSSINILPRQNSNNALSDSLTFGQLIEKWEENDPIPEPDPELADVDSIGKKIRVFFSGHLSRVLGLDNGYAKEYDEYMKEFTVEKPKVNSVSGNGDTTIYNKLFGSVEE